MGLWAWTINQLGTHKFWKLLKKEGFIQTYLRGHKTMRHAHDIAGRLDVVKCVGQDQFGNKYYEDFDVVFKHTRRWVEYSEYYKPLGITSDRVPPPWHGWLSHQYDDLPSEEKYFVDPHYQKPHTENLSGTPQFRRVVGGVTNPNRQMDRKAANWQPDQLSSGQFDGKKLIKKETKLYEDVVEKQ